MAEIGRPPILRVRHQGVQVLDHRIEVEALEFLGVVERLAHRIGQGGVLVENLKVQLFGHQSRFVGPRAPPVNGHLLSLVIVLSDCSAFFRLDINLENWFSFMAATHRAIA